MGKFIDISGKTFGRWTVIKRADNDKWGCVQFLCICSCNKQSTRVVLAKSLKDGSSKSCGCYGQEKRIKGCTTHGKSKHPLFKVWMMIIQRTENPKDKGYGTYGAYGIKMCDEWKNDFKVFYEWSIENGWRKGLEIDRMDVNGDYCPDNCQFLTKKENLAVGKQHMKKSNTSGFTGVSWSKNENKYKARISIGGKKFNIGTFTNLLDAVLARKEFEIEHFGKQLTNIGRI